MVPKTIINNYLSYWIKKLNLTNILSMNNNRYIDN